MPIKILAAFGGAVILILIIGFATGNITFHRGRKNLFEGISDEELRAEL